MTTGTVEKGMRISGRIMVLIIIAAILAGVFFTVASIYLNAAPTTTTSMTGTLYVDDSGQLNGTSQYVATYNVSLSSVGGTGAMNLTLLSKSADMLTVHNYTVTALVANPFQLNMTVDGKAVTLSWINNSTVWKQDNESYIGSWGPSAPADQIVGILSPQDFPGLPAGYYVILSITIPAQPPDTIPFVIRSLS
jgi:hypothetical protein